MMDPQPRREGSKTLLKPELATPERAQLINYRCPVCGQMVDAANADQILLHHEHVTHPRRFRMPAMDAA